MWIHTVRCSIIFIFRRFSPRLPNWRLPSQAAVTCAMHCCGDWIQWSRINTPASDDDVFHLRGLVNILHSVAADQGTRDCLLACAAPAVPGSFACFVPAVFISLPAPASCCLTQRYGSPTVTFGAGAAAPSSLTSLTVPLIRSFAGAGCSGRRGWLRGISVIAR